MVLNVRHVFVGESHVLFWVSIWDGRPVSADRSPSLEHSLREDANVLVIRTHITGGRCQPDIKLMEITYTLWPHCVHISISRKGKGMHVRFDSFELWCSGDLDVR